MKYSVNNLLLVDFRPPYQWRMLSFLEKETSMQWQERVAVSNKPRKSKLYNLKRILIYFLFPLKVMLKGYGGCENVLAWQQFYGLNLAFWLRVFRKRKTARIFVSTFIYKPKGEGFFGKLYRRYMDYCVSSKYIDKVFVFSEAEVSEYSKAFPSAVGKFEFVALGIDSSGYPEAEKGDYVFSVGRSNRDYHFLIKALSRSDFNLRIATDEELGDIPQNVEVLGSCFGDDMLSEMAKSFCVVIPLDNPSISAGQLAIAQALYIGKPVVVTKSNGITDYVEDGVTGLIVDKKEDNLLAALESLVRDGELYERLSANGKESAASIFSEARMVAQMSKIITGDR